jgi:RHS repeat-associated protein
VAASGTATTAGIPAPGYAVRRQDQTDVASATRTATIPDIQGSIVATLDSTSTTLTPANYLPFGANASAPDTFAYTGQRIDPESGLYYYRARHYSPLLGRFLQPDPIRYRGGLNLYAYVGNDPLNATDPNGQVADYIGGAANSAANYAYQNPLQALGIAAAVGATIFAPENLPALPEEIAGIEGTAGVAEGAEALELGTAESWSNPSTLADHFARHGADFGATNEADYANQASQFLQRSQAGGLPTQIDANGTIRVYDSNTNTFGAYNANGTTRTFYQPSSPTYWSRQPGVPPTIFGGP